MADGKVAEIIEMKEERINEAFAMAWKAHESPEKHFLLKKIRRSPKSKEVIISFPANGSPRDWFSGRPFGQTQINLVLFPSLRSIGNDEAATVNEAFLLRFQDIIGTSLLQAKVEEAMTKKKQIVFTGHSSGAPVAILTTLWALDKYLTRNITLNTNYIPPQCVTFGSPLVGDHIFSHATRREKWSGYFFHFVTRYDIMPRTLLAPLSSFEKRFDPILQFFNPKSKAFMDKSIGKDAVASDLYLAVMTNVATVTSHAACKLMGKTNESLETLTNLIHLSPYRPFGTYIFCTRTGKLIVVRNPDAILQLMFFSAQLSTGAEVAQIADRSLQEHLSYGSELRKCINMQNMVYLDQLVEIPLSWDGSDGDNATINMALKDLDLSITARLCLRAAGELEKHKSRNEAKINEKKAYVETKIKELEKYKDKCQDHKTGYYDAFKMHEDHDDFQANVKRLEMAGVWDEIIKLLIKYELPDEFEGRHEWVELGTAFRRLFEPIDIANYYRQFLRHTEAGPYMGRGRPKRYRYPQRWLEHARRIPKQDNSESTFWAEVEELCIKTSSNNRSFEDVKQEVLQLEKQVVIWSDKKELGRDVFLEGSTFVKWWRTLPNQHREASCIRDLIYQTNQ